MISAFLLVFCLLKVRWSIVSKFVYQFVCLVDVVNKSFLSAGSCRQRLEFTRSTSQARAQVKFKSRAMFESRPSFISLSLFSFSFSSSYVLFFIQRCNSGKRKKLTFRLTIVFVL